MKPCTFLWVGTLVISCAHQRPEPLPTLPTPNSKVEVVDLRLHDSSEWGRFEELFEADLTNLIRGTLAARLQSFDGFLRVSVLDLRWVWRTSPFFLAHLSGVARFRLDRKPAAKEGWCEGVDGASVKSSSVATGNSLDEARRLVLDALYEAFARIDEHAGQMPCPSAKELTGN